MEKNKEYERVTLKIIDLCAADIITTSTPLGGGSNTGDDNGWTTPNINWS